VAVGKLVLAPVAIPLSVATPDAFAVAVPRTVVPRRKVTVAPFGENPPGPVSTLAVMLKELPSVTFAIGEIVTTGRIVTDLLADDCSA
jgi:hypothetical protein